MCSEILKFCRTFPFDDDVDMNRLDAQKLAVKRLTSHFVKQVAIGTMDKTAFGIASSLTTDTNRFPAALRRPRAAAIASSITRSAARSSR
jgi:hypothetical protein